MRGGHQSPIRDYGPPRKRTRAVDLILLWIIFCVPSLVGIWFWIGWYSLLVLAGLLWATWNYYRKGERWGSKSYTASAIDHVPKDGPEPPIARGLRGGREGL